VPDTTRIEQVYSAFFETELPTDLALLLAWLGAAILAIFIPILSESPVRIVLALPVVLFFPGYALVSALFPQKGDIDLLERFALSVGLSIAIVPLIGLGLNYTAYGIRLVPLLISVSLFTFLTVLAAHYRRARCPAEERFVVSFRKMAAEVQKEFAPSGSRTDRILTAVLVVAIIAAIATTVFVIVVPKPGEHFTEFYILGEDRMAEDYPDVITAGVPYPMFIGIGNHEYRTVQYTVETWGVTTRVDPATNLSRIATMDPLWQGTVSLPHNETVVSRYDLAVPDTKYSRVEFLLFNETVPGPDVTGEERIRASYRDLHLWVTVRPAS